MLTQMRGFTRSWISYLLLFVLTVAFAIWGINDVFNGAGSQDVASVSGRDISPTQLSRELDIEIRQIRAQGTNISQQDAVDAGLHLQILERLIGRRAIDAFAEKIGVSIGDTAVANYIRQLPPVQNPMTGGFDQASYNSLLGQLRYTPAEFEEEIRGDLTRQMVLEPLLAGVRAPTSFGAALYTHDMETRRVTVAEAGGAAVGAIPAPTEAQLQMFWEERQEQLRVPEYRALTLVFARPQDFIARVSVPEARLREEFELRRVALTQPERRSYVRISAQTEEQANQIVQRLAAGEDAQAVATALSLQLTRGDSQPRADITDVNVAAAVFSMQPRQARAVRGELSPWVAVRLENVTAAQAPDFAALRDDLRNAIAADEAAEMLNAAVGAYDDARAAGTPALQAARDAGLAVLQIPAVDSHGHDANDAPIAALAEQDELVRAAFETPEGDSSEFIPIGDADVVVAVDSITPSSVRPLADVREQLTQAWTGRERGRRLRELGDEVASAVQGGQTFAAAARAARLNIAPPGPAEINRRDVQRALPRGLASQIFSVTEGSVVSEVSPDGQALLVAYVERINRADPAAAPQLVEAARAQMEQSLSTSFGEAVQSEVIARANPRRNEQLLNATFRQSGDGEEEDAAQ